MARAARVQAPGCYHVYSRGAGGTAYFRDDGDRTLFCTLLERTARRHDWELEAFCAMTTHYHALITTRAPNLSRGMQYVNSIYVQRFNARWGRFGTLVAGRFGSRPVEDEEQWEVAVTYIFYNPVKAGMCVRPGDWPWSGGSLFAAVSAL